MWCNILFYIKYSWSCIYTCIWCIWKVIHVWHYTYRWRNVCFQIIADMMTTSIPAESTPSPATTAAVSDEDVDACIPPFRCTASVSCQTASVVSELHFPCIITSVYHASIKLWIMKNYRTNTVCKVSSHVFYVSFRIEGPLSPLSVKEARVFKSSLASKTKVSFLTSKIFLQPISIGLLILCSNALV